MRALRAAAVILLLVVDRATKLWAGATLEAVGTIPVLPFFDLTYVENTGAAFGMGRGAGRLLTVVSIVLIVVLERMRRRWPKDDAWLQWGALLVTTGALGNLYDRLTRGFVVDFLHIHYWPVFNVADSCITIGAVMLAWGMKDDRASAIRPCS